MATKTKQVKSSKGPVSQFNWLSMDWMEFETFAKANSIEDFLQTGDLNKSSVKIKNASVFFAEDQESLYLVRNNSIYYCEYSRLQEQWHIFPAIGYILSKGEILLNADTGTYAQFIDLQNFKMDQKNYCSAWLNNNPLIEEMNQWKDKNKEIPVCSFACLARFYGEKENVIQKKLNDGKLSLLDTTPENFIELTNEEKKLFKKGQKLTPPEMGYSLLGQWTSKKQRTVHVWHRSGSILLADKEEGFHILLGQDEGSYFGVELKGKPKTIQAAYLDLTPQIVRDKDHVRQGEWFIVNVPVETVPSLDQCVLHFESGAYLPIESAESNRHYINTLDGRVSKKGEIFASNPTLCHVDHSNASMTGWCRFYKNTAVRSFSEQGVD